MEVEEEAHDKFVGGGSAMSLDAEGTPNEDAEEDRGLSKGGKWGGGGMASPKLGRVVEGEEEMDEVERSVRDAGQLLKTLIRYLECVLLLGTRMCSLTRY